MKSVEIIASMEVWVGLVAGIVGACLGLYNFFKARSKEKNDARTEQADWQRWVEFIEKQRSNPASLVYDPEPGSEAHKWAERMVARGMLRRELRGLHYTLKDD